VHRKAYNTVVRGEDRSNSASASAVGKSHAVIKEDVEATDPTPLNVDDYPAVQYWYQSEHRAEKARRDAEDKKNARPTRKNASFWFLEDSEGVKINNNTVDSLRAEAKVIWNEICDDHGPIGLPWSSVSHKLRVEYLKKLEREFPFLRLCADHYKATAVATTDYTRWYKLRYPKAESSRKWPRAKMRNPRRSQRRRTSSRRVTRQRADEEDEEMSEMLDETSANDEKEDNEEEEDIDQEDEDGDEQEDKEDVGSDGDKHFAEDVAVAEIQTVRDDTNDVEEPQAKCDTVRFLFMPLFFPMSIFATQFRFQTMAMNCPRLHERVRVRYTAMPSLPTWKRLPRSAANRPSIPTLCHKTSVPMRATRVPTSIAR
jgi:hypothetical protein